MNSLRFNLNDSSKAPSSGGGWGEAVDLNCDMGEGMGNDESIMPWISSASIACGYHAGDVNTIWETTALAIKHNVRVGAHVSFPDKENFGRKELNLSPAEIYELVIQQLILINDIVGSFGITLYHSKPHGALYNLSAKDPLVAKAIANAVKDFDQALVLYGLSGSHSIREAQQAGLKTASETFADRSYQPDGSLTPRTDPAALIQDADKAMQQALQMVKNNSVTAVNGKEIPVIAETICIHGDGKHAAAFAKAIHQHLKEHHIDIKAI